MRRINLLLGVIILVASLMIFLGAKEEGAKKEAAEEAVPTKEEQVELPNRDEQPHHPFGVDQQLGKPN